MFNRKVSRLSCSLLCVVLMFLMACSESENDGGITGTGSPLESYLKNGMVEHNQLSSSCAECLEEPTLEK